MNTDNKYEQVCHFFPCIKAYYSDSIYMTTAFFSKLLVEKCVILENLLRGRIIQVQQISVGQLNVHEPLIVYGTKYYCDIFLTLINAIRAPYGLAGLKSQLKRDF